MSVCEGEFRNQMSARLRVLISQHNSGGKTSTSTHQAGMMMRCTDEDKQH